MESDALRHPLSQSGSVDPPPATPLNGHGAPLSPVQPLFQRSVRRAGWTLTGRGLVVDWSAAGWTNQWFRSRQGPRNDVDRRRRWLART